MHDAGFQSSATIVAIMDFAVPALDFLIDTATGKRHPLPLKQPGPSKIQLVIDSQSLRKLTPISRMM
jgi:hypothetical protein